MSSKRPKEIWSIIYRILRLNPQPLHADPDELNSHLASTAKRLTGRKGKSFDEFIDIINSLPDSDGNKFVVRDVTYTEVISIFFSLKLIIEFYEVIATAQP